MRLLLLSAALLLLVASCRTLPPPPPSLPAPDPPRERPIVYPGVDMWRYPGDELLQAWARHAPYRWTGYYLSSPCHRDASWMGRRTFVERLGWGTAVLYVGQQVFDNDPSPPPPTGPVVCSRSLLTAEQGRRDGLDAIAKAASEGFPQGSVVYLDVERMNEIPPAMFVYLRAWIETLLQDGRFEPGVYAHRRNAADLLAHARASFHAFGRTRGPRFWVAGTGGFTLDSLPSASGLPSAAVWQGILDVNRTFGGFTLQVDENVALRPSPSAP